MQNPRQFLALLAGIFLLGSQMLRAVEHDPKWLARWWQTEEGLPDNSVNGLAQTEDGYLWIGTPTGLARFDGIRFENISLTNVIMMPNHGIVAMLRGRHGALWLAMDRGALVRLSGKTSRAFVGEVTNAIPNGLAESADGSVFLAYRGGTVLPTNPTRVRSL